MTAGSRIMDRIVLGVFCAGLLLCVVLSIPLYRLALSLLEKRRLKDTRHQ